MRGKRLGVGRHHSARAFFRDDHVSQLVQLLWNIVDVLPGALLLLSRPNSDC